VLIVMKLDRLGRDVVDVTLTIERLGKMGIRVHCLQLGGTDLNQRRRQVHHEHPGQHCAVERDILIEPTQAGLQRA
jgi:putative DNA-invertase from lambdoid prophage Rac